MAPGIVAPVVGPDATITAPTNATKFSNYLTASVPTAVGNTYQWSATGGTIVSGYANTAVTYFNTNGVGTLTLQCIVTNGGNSNTGTKTVTVIDLPLISGFSTSNSNMNVGDSATLTGGFSGGTGVIDNGVGAVTSMSGVVVHPTETTTYILTVTNAAGTAVTQAVTVIVRQPDASISRPASVTAGSTAYTASVPNQGGFTYAWTISGGTITTAANGQSINFTASAVGTVTLTCKVTNPFGYFITRSVQIPAIAAPSITSYTTTAANVVPGGAATLTATYANGTGVINQGVGPVTSGVGIQVNPSVTTSYQLVVTNGAGSTSTSNVNVTVPAPPNTTITCASPVSSGVAGTTASVPSQVGATYLWTITGGTITAGSTGSTVTYTPGAIGTCNLSCKVTNAAGTFQTGNATATIIAAPTITSLTASPTALVPGGTTTLTGVFANGQGSIDNGVGPVISGTGVTLAPVGTKTFTLSVVNAAGTIVTRTLTVTVDAFGPNATVTAGSPVSAAAVGLTASVPSQSGSTYSWAISGGTITAGSTTNSVTYTAGAVGTCTLTCTVTSAANVVRNGSANVSVIAAPSIASFTGSLTTINAGQSTVLTPTFSNGVGVLLPDGVTVTSGTGVTVTPGSTTGYSLRVTNAAGTVAISSVTITVNPPTPGGISTATPVTTGSSGLGASVPYDASSTYSWSIPGGGGTITSSTTATSITYTAGAVGTITLQCVVTKSGVPTTYTRSVSIVAIPTISAFTASPANIISGNNSTLSATYANGVGVVDTGVGSLASGGTATVSPTTTKTYTLTVTNTAGRSVTSTATVTLPPAPIATIQADSTVTVGTQYNTASVPFQTGATYLWTVSGGTIPGGYTNNQNSFTYLTGGAPGTISLGCTVTNAAGVATTGNATVTSIAAPAVTTFTASAANVAPGTPVTLTGTYTGATATLGYDNGGGTSDARLGKVLSGFTVQDSPVVSTTYDLVVSNAVGRTQMAQVRVTVPPPPDATITAASPVTTGIASYYSASVPVQSGSTYAWTISGGTITSGATGTVVVYTPGAVGSCTLNCTVTSPVGVQKAGSVTVTILPVPSITSFISSVQQLTFGQSATLTAVYANGTGVVGQGVGPLTSGGTATVTPGQTTTYVLTVTNGAGYSVSTSQVITLFPLALNVIPGTSILPLGFNQLFLARDSAGGSPTVNWTVKEANGGTINGNGVYSTPAGPGTFHIQAASPTDPTLKGQATITVPLEVGVDPEAISLALGATYAFQASVPGFSDQRIAWSVQEGVAGGSVSIAGLYTAPNIAGIYHVVATSMADPTKAAIATVQVGGAAVHVQVTPNSIQLAKNSTQTFSAMVEGSSNTAVTWSASGGTIDSAGVYTAPNTFGTYIVTATSVADPNVKDEVTVVVSGGSSSAAMAYDANGNLLSDGSRTFEWDGENRLVAVNILATGHRSEFTYDGLSRRAEIIEKDNNVVVSDQKYLWDRLNISEQRDATGGTVQKRFYDQGFVDTDGTPLTYTKDHLGSIRELTDSSQVTRARYDYDPFGRMVKISGDKDSRFGYASMEYHGSSGLSLAVFRAYDPNLGRWINRDPVAEFGGRNLYSYVGNSPTTTTDPLGFCFQNNEQVIQCLLTFENELKAINKRLDGLQKQADDTYEAGIRALDRSIAASSKKPRHESQSSPPDEVAEAGFGFSLGGDYDRLTKAWLAVTWTIMWSRARAWAEYLEKIKQCKLCETCPK